MTHSRDERDALVKRLEAFADREWKKRKQDGLARGLEMLPPAGEYEQLLIDAIAALTAQPSAGEPVAWMTVDGRLFNQWDLAEHHADGVTKVTPLYAHPAASGMDEGE